MAAIAAAARGQGKSDKRNYSEDAYRPLYSSCVFHFEKPPVKKYKKAARENVCENIFPVEDCGRQFLRAKEEIAGCSPRHEAKSLPAGWRNNLIGG